MTPSKPSLDARTPTTPDTETKSLLTAKAAVDLAVAEEVRLKNAKVRACIKELGDWWPKLEGHPCGYSKKPEILAILAKHKLRFTYTSLTLSFEEVK